MVNLEPYGPPITISPLIKFSRYTFLGLGIIYGLIRNNYLQKKDKEHKAYNEKMMPIWKAMREEKKRESYKAEINNLKKEGIYIN